MEVVVAEEVVVAVVVSLQLEVEVEAKDKYGIQDVQV